MPADYTAQLNQVRAKALASQKESAKKTNSSALASTTSEITLAEFLMILPIAFLGDVCGWVALLLAEIGGISLVIVRIIYLIIAFILGFWCLFRLRKFPSERFVITGFLEIIPVVGDFLPTWTIFIIWTFLDQRNLIPKAAKRAIGTMSKIQPKAIKTTG